MKTEQLIDCQGITLESTKPFAFSCCDCGLTHHMVIVSEDGKPVGFAVKRIESTRAVTLQVAEDACQPARTMTVSVVAPQPPASVQPLAVGVESTGCLSREVLIERLTFLAANSTHGPIANETYRDAARLLAASPQPPGGMVPLTESELRKPWRDAENEDDFSNEYQIWLSGFRRAEQVHGIKEGS